MNYMYEYNYTILYINYDFHGDQYTNPNPPKN